MAFKIGPRCEIHPTAVINVKNGFIGSDSIIGEYAVIEGNDVRIGREAYIGRFAQIGGGSCFDSTAFLKAGNWLHMGTNSHINIARGVIIGNEFGFGIDSKILANLISIMQKKMTLQKSKRNTISFIFATKIRMNVLSMDGMHLIAISI